MANGSGAFQSSLVSLFQKPVSMALFANNETEAVRASGSDVLAVATTAGSATMARVDCLPSPKGRRLSSDAQHTATTSKVVKSEEAK